MTAHAPMGTFEGAIAADSDVQRLTLMERECLRRVADRQSSKEIAAVLGIAKTSVDTYCNRARRKLGVADRYEAARLLVGSGPTAPARITRPLDAPLTEAAPARRMARGMTRAVAVLLGCLVFATLGAGSVRWSLAGFEDIVEQRHLKRMNDIAKYGYFGAKWFP